MTKLNWEQLFFDVRIRDLYNNNHHNNKFSSNIVDIQNEFDRDYARIIYSSSVRRLQDKTQVFPLQQNDFIRTRLTHSLEVSSLSESMGWQIAHILHTRNVEGFEDLKQLKRLPSLLKVSGLLHDLGNPPFGHFGEYVIKNWFSNFFNEDSKENNKLNYSTLKSEKNMITEEQKCDFKYFDGNAQGIRILSRLQLLNDEFGANLTLATLATLMKYPWSSSNVKCKGENKNIGKEKFGYMYSEKTINQFILENMMNNKEEVRHPATFILEAADDIAYIMADLEDSVKKRLITWNDIYSEEFKSVIENSISELAKRFDKIDRFNYQKRFDTFSNTINKLSKDIPDYDLICSQNLKSFLQSIMIYVVIDRFTDEVYDQIMSGNFKNEALLNIEPLENILKHIKDLIFKKAFSSAEVLELELVGDTVITKLLDLFIPAILKISCKNSTKTKKEEKLVRLISDNFLYVQCLPKSLNDKDWRLRIKELTDYEKIQIVVDYISGMTDSYAVSLHKKLMNGRM